MTARAWIMAIVASCLVLPLLAAPHAAHAVDPSAICSVRFTVGTGKDGLRDDSKEIISLAGQDFVFIDSDGDGEPDANPFHRGGTGDSANAAFTWEARLPVCVPRSAMAGGFTIRHVTESEWADNWDLRTFKVADAGTGHVFFEAGHPGRRLHRFYKNRFQTWNSNSVNPVEEKANAAICRLTFAVTTGFEDGIRDDSTEIIRLAGRPVVFDDSDGDGEPDANPFHRGGTGDHGSATFEWTGTLTPCVPRRDLVRGFEFEHVSRENNYEIDADNWDLAGLVILDADSGRTYFASPPTGDRNLNRFDVNANRIWNTNQARSTSDADADGDGLKDDWEIHGYDGDDDHQVDVNFPEMGADPRHKDVYVELDWEQGRAPTHAGISAVRNAFAAAPVDAGHEADALPPGRTIRGIPAPPNPDGRPGITLHVDAGDRVDPSASEGVPGLTCADGTDNGTDGYVDGSDTDCLSEDAYVEDPPHPATCGNDRDDDGDGRVDADDEDCLIGDRLHPDDRRGGQVLPVAGTCNLGGDYVALRNAGFHPTRRQVFHYGIQAAPPADCPSGGQGETGGNEMIILTLHPGTLMHELGHNLNLRHGGDDDVNCKPNYVSVMNYDHGHGIARVSGGTILDFSPPRLTVGGQARGQAPLPVLREDNLSETAVLDSTDTANRFRFVDSTGRKIPNDLSAPAEWDPTDTVPMPDVNVNTADRVSGDPPECAVDTSGVGTLTGHHDWARVSLPFAHFRDQTGSAASEPELSPTTEEMEIARQADTVTDLGVTLAADHDPVISGTRLVYTATITNHGRNPATSVVLTGTLPANVTYARPDPSCPIAGRTVTCRVGLLPAGASRAVEITVRVNPGTTAALTTRVSADDIKGPDPVSGNDEAVRTTGVVAPAATYPVTIDPTGLSYTDFGVSGHGWHGGRAAKTLSLPPGEYTYLVPVGGEGAVFRVTAEGTVDYDDPGLLAGRGTTTLTARGHAVGFDGTGLSYAALGVSGTGWWDARQVQTLRLFPGPHGYVAAGVTSVPFRVTGGGLIDYDPAYDGMVAGEGTNRLTAHGHAITVDGTGLSYASFGVTAAGHHDARQPRVLRLFPGFHTYIAAGVTMPGPQFRVTAGGLVEVDAEWSERLTGTGTATVVATGLAVTVDATAVTYPHFGVAGTGWRETRVVQPLRLFPGGHTYLASTSSAATPFTVDTAGLVDYASQYDTVFGGRDTGTLRVLGPARAGTGGRP
ncbi:hypothetical protein [Streptosporangium sp. NPDC048865]|uniref:hypothetical protein n=1 Tax=Streptosporangium sp. NPDC048865 TaxID=3155766 RepID=UPI003440EB12